MQFPSNSLKDDLYNLGLVFKENETYKVYRSRITAKDYEIILGAVIAFANSELNPKECKSLSEAFVHSFFNGFREFFPLQEGVRRTAVGLRSFSSDDYKALKWDLYAVCDKMELHPSAKYLLVMAIMDGIRRNLVHREFCFETDRLMLKKEDSAQA